MILTPDNEYAVVLDACVLVPMPLCDTLLRLAEEPALYRPLWSDPILEEVARVLRARLALTAEQVARRIGVMQKAFPEAIVGIPEGFTDGIHGIDAKDRHVVAAAVLARANAIVSLNQKHFPSYHLDPYLILLQTPNSFLVHQFHLNPDLILEKLDAQAAARRMETAGCCRVAPSCCTGICRTCKGTLMMRNKRAPRSQPGTAQENPWNSG